MAHEHGPAMRETIEIGVVHCTCGAWKRGNGEWMPGPFGSVERLLSAILTAPPEVRALVERIVAGGRDAAEDVVMALTSDASTREGLDNYQRENTEVAARLRALAGT